MLCCVCCVLCCVGLGLHLKAGYILLAAVLHPRKQVNPVLLIPVCTRDACSTRGRIAVFRTLRTRSRDQRVGTKPVTVLRYILLLLLLLYRSTRHVTTVMYGLFNTAMVLTFAPRVVHNTSILSILYTGR